jgi:hypothetical protein
MRAYPLTSEPPKPLVRHGKRTSSQPRAARRIARTLATLPIVMFLLLAAASAALAGTQGTVVATGLTEPSGAVVDPDGDIWVSDGSGFCETTAIDGVAGSPGALTSFCDPNVSGQPAAADGGNVVLIPDGKRQALIHRLTWDAGAGSYFDDGTIPVGHPIPAAVSIGPDGAAYVSFTRLINVERIANATSASPGAAEDVGTSADARPAGMVAGWNSTHTNTVVYIAESKGGVSELVPGAGNVAAPTEFGAATLGATPPQFNALTYDPGTDTLFAATALGAPSGFPDVIASMSVANPHVQDASAATGYSNVGGLAVGGADRLLAVDDPSGTGVTGVGRALSTGVADTAAPSLTIDSPSANPNVTTSSSPAIMFHANESASFSCRLDAGAFAPCSSGVTFSGLAPGGHTVDVQATDLAGNTSSVVSRHFTVRTPAAAAAGTAPTPAGQVPGAGVLGASVDHAAPRLTLSLAGGRIRLVGNTISLPFRCSETCAAKASGTISVQGSVRLFKLSGTTKVVEHGRTARLVVRVPRSALGSIRRALRAHRVVTVRLALRAEDLAGNVRTSTAHARLSR